MDRTAQNPGFFVSGGLVFLSSFSGSFDESFSRRLVSGYQEPRTAQCSARVSRFLQPRGRWARSGKKASGCQLSAGDGGVASRVDEREQFACEVLEQQRAPAGRWQSSGSQQLAGAGGGALRAGAFPPVPIDLADREHVAGCAGRQGVEQPAPGGWRAFRPLPEHCFIIFGSAFTTVLSPCFVSVSKFVFVARFWCQEFMRAHAWC